MRNGEELHPLAALAVLAAWFVVAAIGGGGAYVGWSLMRTVCG